MKARNTGPDHVMQALRTVALRHPGVEEALACKGTTIESATFKVHGKAFLFLRPGTAMLKLDLSQPAASALAARKPSGLRIGTGGWATVDLASPNVPPMTVLARWVAESYSLFAAKKVPRSASKK